MRSMQAEPARTEAGGFPAPGESCSAGSVWRVVSAGIGETLLAAPQRHALAAALAQLPPFSATIVERPLGGAAPGVDISLCATPADGGMRTWPSHGAWPSIRAFYHAWTDEASLLHRSVPSIWLEFDRPQAASAPPSPCFFANMRRLTAADRASAIGAILAMFCAPGQAAPAEDRIASILHFLPPSAHLDFLGLMLARSPASTRICLALPAAQLVDFLRKAGYRADERVHAMTRLAMQHSDSIVLHLDMEARRDATIGLELKPARHDGWPLLLAALERERLCTAEERWSLLAFPRTAGMVRRGGRLERADELSVRAPGRWEQAEAFAFTRQLNHVKLVCAAGKAPAAKAYLHIGYKWKCRAEKPDPIVL